MRATMVLLLGLVATPMTGSAQIFGGMPIDPDTVPVARIVEEWERYVGRDAAISRLVRSILFDRQNERADELFQALLPLLRDESPFVAVRTAGMLGRGDAESPGRWTPVLLNLVRELLLEGRDGSATTLVGFGSPALRNGGVAPLLARVRTLSDQRPDATYSAEILAPSLMDLPGGREGLQGMLDRGELRAGVAAIVRMNLQGQGRGRGGG